LAEFKDPRSPGEPDYGVLIQPYVDGDSDEAEENYTVVSFTPYVCGGRCYRQLRNVTRNRGYYPWETLFHELVHAFREAAGFGWFKRLSGGLAGYDSREEFIAVLVTNIYMSDPTNKRADHVGLRRDHADFRKLEPELSDSLGFFQSSEDTFVQVEQFCRENLWFTKHLAEVKATFNPIAAYYHNPDEARKRSKSFEAFRHDFWDRQLRRF